MDILVIKMLKILFTVSLICFVLGQVARVQFGNGVAVTLLDLTVGIFVGVWFARQLYRGKQLNDALLVPILLFFTFGTLSLIINSAHFAANQLVVAFLYALRWLLYAMLYFVVKDFDKGFRRKILNLLVFAGGIVLFAGYMQYFFYNNLRNLYYLGWDDHLYRMFSVFLDPNFAGVFYALYLFLLFGMLLDTHMRKERKYFFTYGLLSFLTILALVLTYSRSGLIAFVAGMAVFLVMKQGKKLALPILGIGALFLLLFSNVWVEGRNPFRVVSSQERLKSVSEAIHVIQKNPVIGVGFNAYRYAQNRYGFRTSEKWQISHADAGTDNSLLFVLATTGVVGLSAYVFLWIRVFRVASPSPKRRGLNGTSYLRAMVVATMAGLIASSLFLNTLFYPMLMYWMWILLVTTENT